MRDKDKHYLISGILPDDNTGEFFADKHTRKVFFIQNGSTMHFSKVPTAIKNKLLKSFLADKAAQESLKNFPADKQLEEYTFCCYGKLDAVPDVQQNGQLGSTEFFKCDLPVCRCQNWQSKKIEVNGTPLTKREMECLPLFATDMADKQIADALKISIPTLDVHKMNLFKKFGVHSKTGLISKAITLNVIEL